jgi:hypothetical protein
MLATVLSRLLHDPVSVYLLVGQILATVAVGLGIIWEHGSPEVRARANRFVIGGIIVETFCSVVLFAYDANIIGAQNDKLVVAETKLEKTDAELLQAHRLAGPRVIRHDEFLKALEGKPKAHVAIWYLADVSDGWLVAYQLEALLKEANWDVEEPIPIPEPDQNHSNMPRAMAAGGTTDGVTVVSRDFVVRMSGHPRTVLLFAILAATEWGAHAANDPSVPGDTLRIVVAAKPDPTFTDVMESSYSHGRPLPKDWPGPR